MTMKSEPNEFEHALMVCQDKLDRAAGEIERLQNLAFSSITGLKSICRHRPNALHQIDAIQGEITDVYYDRSMGVTPALFVRYTNADGDTVLERVRLED